MRDHPKTVAVFGLSGVGKSFLISRTLEDSACRIASTHAGTLIGIGRGASSDELRLLPKERILANQEILVQQLAAFVFENMSADCVLLDGHCVVDNGRCLVGIPVEVIDRLHLSLVVYVREEPETIYQRRKIDLTRDRPEVLTDQLAMQQDAALEICREYERELDVPLLILSASDHSVLASRLLEMIDQT